MEFSALQRLSYRLCLRRSQDNERERHHVFFWYPPFLQAVSGCTDSITQGAAGCKGCTAVVHLWASHPVWPAFSPWLLPHQEINGFMFHDLLYSKLITFGLWLQGAPGRESAI